MIFEQEQEIEKNRKRNAALLVSKFKTKNYLRVRLRNPIANYEINSIFSCGNAGTVYKTITLTDEWGVLESRNGVLIDRRWKNLYLPQPEGLDSDKVAGDGWALKINPGFNIEKKDGFYLEISHPQD